MPHRLDDTDGGLLATFVVASTLVLALLVASVIGSSLDVANGPSVGAIDLGRERRAPAPSAAAPPAPQVAQIAAPVTGAAAAVLRTTSRRTSRPAARTAPTSASTRTLVAAAPASQPSTVTPAAPARVDTTAAPTRSLATVSAPASTPGAPAGAGEKAHGNSNASHATDAVRGPTRSGRVRDRADHTVDRPRGGAGAKAPAAPSGHHGRGRIQA